MSRVIDSDLFSRELGGWALRGGLCAVPSAVWAFMSDFRHPSEVFAMIAGVAVYVAGFAWVSTRETHSGQSGGEMRFMRTMKSAASLKAAAAFLAVAGYVIDLALRMESAVFAIVTFPDAWCGVVALAFINKLAGISGSGTVARLDSGSWTFATTLVQGAILSLLLGALAVLIMAWRWCLSRLWKANLSPARFEG